MFLSHLYSGSNIFTFLLLFSDDLWSFLCFVWLWPQFGPRRSLLSHAKEPLVFEVQLLKVLWSLSHDHHMPMQIEALLSCSTSEENHSDSFLDFFLQISFWFFSFQTMCLFVLPKKHSASWMKAQRYSLQQHYQLELPVRAFYWLISLSIVQWAV